MLNSRNFYTNFVLVVAYNCHLPCSENVSCRGCNVWMYKVAGIQHGFSINWSWLKFNRSDIRTRYPTTWWNLVWRFFEASPCLTKSQLRLCRISQKGVGNICAGVIANKMGDFLVTYVLLGMALKTCQNWAFVWTLTDPPPHWALMWHFTS